VIGNGQDRVSDFLKRDDMQRACSAAECSVTRSSYAAAAPIYDVQRCLREAAPGCARGSKSWELAQAWIWDGGVGATPVPDDSRQLIAMGFNQRGRGRLRASGNAEAALSSTPTSAHLPCTLGGGFSMGVDLTDDGSPATPRPAEARTFRSCTRRQRARHRHARGNENHDPGRQPGGNVTGVATADGDRRASSGTGTPCRPGSLGGDYAQGQAVNDKGMVAGLSGWYRATTRSTPSSGTARHAGPGILPGCPDVATGVNEAE